MREIELRYRKKLLCRIGKMTIGDAIRIPDALGGGFIVRVSNYTFVVQQDNSEVKICGGQRQTLKTQTGKVQIARDKVIDYLVEGLRGQKHDTRTA